MEQNQLSVSEQDDDLDKTIIADIVNNKRDDEKKSQETEEDDDIVNFKVSNIKPHPEPDQDKNITELVEGSYKPKRAIITLEYNNNEVTKRLSWENAKKISNWYTKESKVSHLMGENVSYDRRKDEILYPENQENKINCILYKIMVKILKLKMVQRDENRKLSLKQKYADISVFSTAVFGSWILYYCLSNFGGLEISSGPFTVFIYVLSLVLSVVAPFSVVYSGHIIHLRLKSMISS